MNASTRGFASASRLSCNCFQPPRSSGAGASGRAAGPFNVFRYLAASGETVPGGSTNGFGGSPARADCVANARAAKANDTTACRCEFMKAPRQPETAQRRLFRNNLLRRREGIRVHLGLSLHLADLQND